MTKVFINGEFIDQNEAKYLMKTVVMYLVMEFMNTLEHMMKLFTVTEHFERFIRVQVKFN